MLASVVTVAFEGVDARRVDVQVSQLSAQEGSFALVGLADKAVAESRERVRGAFGGIGLALPSRRVIVNLAPADLPKEGSHFDLPIALALLASMGRSEERRVGKRGRSRRRAGAPYYSAAPTRHA